jgi:hypothetical protein
MSYTYSNNSGVFRIGGSTPRRKASTALNWLKWMMAGMEFEGDS